MKSKEVTDKEESGSWEGSVSELGKDSAELA